MNARMPASTSSIPATKGFVTAFRSVPQAARHGDDNILLWHRDGARLLASPSFLRLGEQLGTPDMADALRPLGFDFTLLWRRGGRLWMCGGARPGTPLFWQAPGAGHPLRLQDHLPHASRSGGALSEHLDPDWLLNFLAAGYSSGPMELNFSTATIYRDWRQLPPGHVLCIDGEGRTLHCEPFDNISRADFLASDSPAWLGEVAREALRDGLAALTQGRPCGVEFSGGIDSGIVAAAAAAVAPSVTPLCNRYPYPEFRREQLFQDAVAMHNQLAPTFIDGSRVLPLTRMLDVPPHDEPSILTTSWGHLAAMHASCSRLGLPVLLSGHGGDTLFDTPPGQPVHAGTMDPLPADLFGAGLLRRVAERAGETAAILNARPAPWRLAGLWHPAMFDSLFINRVFRHAPLHPLTYTSGFVTPDLVNAIHAYRIISPTRAQYAKRIQKPAAHELFGPLLPESVWLRPGKVNHLGLAYRGLYRSRTDLAQLCEGLDVFAPLLEFDPARVREAMLRGASGLQAGSAWLSRICALLIWLRARATEGGNNAPGVTGSLANS